MEQIFKEGDRVFHYHYGWGAVKSISNSDASEYNVGVSFDLSYKNWFTYDGRELYLEKPTLSFTEYTLEGFSQERPEPLPKPGDIVWVRDDVDQGWRVSHFFGKKGNFYVASLYYLDPSPPTWEEMTTKNPYENKES
jgi:hypothetical protein